MNKSTSFSKKYPEALIKKMAKDFWDKKENRDKYRFLYRRYFFKIGGNRNENINVATSGRAIVYGGL